MPNDGWAAAENARLYADFAEKFPMYRLTSQDLVSRLDLENVSLVVDLACGTGATTEVLLAAVPERARIIAVDGSEAMQAVARQRVVDERVSWVVARLESFDVALDRPGQVDAIVCNSAIWQADLAATFAAVRKVLRPGGQFAFNVGSQFVDLGRRTNAEEPPPATPSIFELMQAVAVYDHGFVPPRPAGPRRPRLTEEQLAALLTSAGLQVRSTAVFEHEQPSEASYAWLRVPVFTEWNFGTLPYEQRMAALDKAYRRLQELEQSNGTPVRRTQSWLVVVAEG